MLIVSESFLSMIPESLYSNNRFLFSFSSALNKITEQISTITAIHTALTPITDVSNPPEIAPARNERLIVENRKACKADSLSFFVTAV